MRRKKQDGIKREPFTTSINAEILQQFRIYCVTNDVYQNDVLEALLKELLNGNDVLVKLVKETLKGSGNVGNTD